jgi:DNA-binding Lrp family transcriptional regulator
MVAVPRELPQAVRAASLPPDVVNAVVLINAARGQIEAVGEQLAVIPGVSEVYSVAGRVDLVAVIRVSSNDDLADVVSNRFAAIEGIAATETLIAFRVYSRADLELGFSLGPSE